MLGPVPMSAARPWAAVGCYRSWPAVGHPRVLAWEDRFPQRDGSTKHRWLPALANDVLQVLRTAAGRPVFAAWFADAVLQQLADAAGAQILTVAPEMRQRLEDKTHLAYLLRTAEVPARLQIPAISVSRPPAYRDAAARLVVQPAQTSGGRGTVFVGDEAGYRQATTGSGPWRISTFVEGFSRAG